jgi:hypothetical protein
MYGGFIFACPPDHDVKILVALSLLVRCSRKEQMTVANSWKLALPVTMVGGSSSPLTPSSPPLDLKLSATLG